MQPQHDSSFRAEMSNDVAVVSQPDRLPDTDPTVTTEQAEASVLASLMQSTR